MEKLIKKLVSKKELFGFDEELIKKIILKYFEANKDVEKKFLKDRDKEKFEKTKIFNFVYKEIKSQLKIIYSDFLNKDFLNKDKILNMKLDKNEIVLKLLKSHKSTFERLEDYDFIYDKIFSFYKSKKVIDICCGFNPISYYFIKDKKISFECYDINKNDSKFLNLFFKKFKINAFSKSLDVFLEHTKIKTNKSDLVFLFKALDSFEIRKKNFSKGFLKSLKSKNIVISFSKKSLYTKKNIRNERRNWLRNFLNLQLWEFYEFETDNEIFFLIKK